ncbi:hypothetical protein AAFF_G00017380 [Aldrovandia affinis]|uniref:Guanine nucleotide-binding protein subunit gamma n=1 Tax=Aldrovandia affinis TaxID=143900 RepID=A0AAD7WGS6_9TELE|nr:hypothetical protein AAFF_G00017380 [Aldrovandia affinis]
MELQCSIYTVYEGGVQLHRNLRHRKQEIEEERRGGRDCTRRGRQQGMKGDTPVNSTMSVGQARKLVEQLKIEASMCRIKVSKAAADLMAYCDAHACEDPLITPVPTSENPFREKKFFCALL